MPKLIYLKDFSITIISVHIRQLLTNDISHRFFKFVVIFRSMRLFFTVNSSNFNKKLICYEIISLIDTMVCSEISSVFGLVLCCNQPVYLCCGLIGEFLHGAGFLLGEIFEKILIIFILILILLALLFNTFRNLPAFFSGFYQRRLLFCEFYMLFSQFTF